MITYLEILTEIKDLILSRIPQLNTGYAYARQDTAKGIVATTGNNGKYVGINDTEGDYFYIRENGNSTFQDWKGLQDCGMSVLEFKPFSLIAVVNDVDEWKLADALKNELLRNKVSFLTREILDPVQVVRDEFKGMPADSIDAGIARIGDRVIVRIDFNVRRPIEANKCEYNLCKEC